MSKFFFCCRGMVALTICQMHFTTFFASLNRKRKWVVVTFYLCSLLLSRLLRPVRPMLSWGKEFTATRRMRRCLYRDVWIMPSLSLNSMIFKEFTIRATLQRLLYARSDHVPYFSRFMLIHHDPFFPIYGLGRTRGMIFGRFVKRYIFLCDCGCFYL